MVQVTRVGNLLILEYFTKDQKRILDGKKLKDGEEEAHFRMLHERDQAFREIKKTFEKKTAPKKDPLNLEKGKFRNANALNNPHLWL